MKTLLLNGVLLKFPDSSELFTVIKNHPGTTLGGLHDLGYRSVFTPLLALLDSEEVFQTGIGLDARYYPNN